MSCIWFPETERLRHRLPLAPEYGQVLVAAVDVADHEEIDELVLGRRGSRLVYSSVIFVALVVSTGAMMVLGRAIARPRFALMSYLEWRVLSVVDAHGILLGRHTASGSVE